MILIKVAVLFVNARLVLLDVIQNCQCGKIAEESRLVGGNETVKNAYPWQVALANKCKTNIQDGKFVQEIAPLQDLIKMRFSPVKFFCGGSIISSKTVITAGHCVSGMKAKCLLVIAGEHNVNLMDGERFIWSTESILFHPSFKMKKPFPNKRPHKLKAEDEIYRN